MKSYKAYRQRDQELKLQESRLITALKVKEVEYGVTEETAWNNKEFMDATWEIREPLYDARQKRENLQPWIKAAHDLTTSHFMDEHGHLLEYGWPGGYQIIYQDKKGSVLCPTCANELGEDEDEYFLDEPPIAGDNYQEGPPIECDGGCGKMIESDYGDPHEKEEEEEG